MSPRRTFALISTPIVAFIIIFSAVLFYARRNYHPIKGRHPHIISTIHVVLLVWVVVIGVVDVYNDTVKCWVLYWAGAMLPNMACFLYVLRGAILYFRHELTHELLAQYQQQYENETSWASRRMSLSLIKGPSSGWFIRHRHWDHPRNYAAAILLAVVVCAIPPSIFQVIQFDEMNQIHNTCEFGRRSYPSIALLLALVGFVVYTSFKLRNVVEGYHIKSEFKVTGFFALIGIAFVFTAAPKKGQTSVNIGSAGIIGSLLGILSASAMWPIYATFNSHTVEHIEAQLAYDDNADEEKSEQDKGPTAHRQAANTQQKMLQAVLQSRELMSDFRRFLLSEFSVENLLFYQQCQLFREGFEGRSPTANFTYAENIFTQFVGEDAPYQVNLPYEIVENIRHDLGPLLKARTQSGAEEQQTSTPFHVVVGVEVSETTARRIQSSATEQEDQNNAQTPAAALGGVEDQRSPTSQAALIEDETVTDEPDDDAKDVGPEKGYKLTADVFDDAARSIFSLMANDSYPRFVTSDFNSRGSVIAFQQPHGDDEQQPDHRSRQLSRIVTDTLFEQGSTRSLHRSATNSSKASRVSSSSSAQLQMLQRSSSAGRVPQPKA